MWEIFSSHNWTGACKESCLKQDRDRADSSMQAVAVDGFMRIIKHISAPRYPKFKINITNILIMTVNNYIKYTLLKYQSLFNKDFIE